MNRGVPPTARKARTGELTPPGVTRPARSNSCADTGASYGDGSLPAPPSQACLWAVATCWNGPSRGPRSAEPAGGLDRPVGEHRAGAGPADRGQRLQDGPLPVDPAVRGRRLDHRVLTADLVGADRDVDGVG